MNPVKILWDEREVNMIPKTIHYCWFGGNPLPSDMKKCISSWKKHCPDYMIKEWNESNFDVNSHPFIAAAYKAKKWAFVSDYARLKIIYDNGGIYFDTDVQLLQNMDELLQYDSFIGVQQVGKHITTGLGFGAVEGSEMIGEMLQEYDSVIFSEDNLLEVACPLLNMKPFIRRGYVYTEEIQKIQDTMVFPPKYFDPLSPGDSDNLLCDETISIHHYSATWLSKKRRFIRKLIRFVGQDRVNKLKMILKAVTKSGQP